MSDVVISFPPPGRLLSMNDRDHWSGHGDLVKTWRKCAYYAAVDHFGAVGPSGRLLKGRWRVDVVLPVPDHRRRDPMNFVASVKPIVDGLVDAGCWPDDTPEYVTVSEPVLLYDSTEVVVRLSEVDL